jgi:hypothetical protein
MVSGGEPIQFHLSPNKEIDWSDRRDVVEYFNCFRLWSTYISNGSYRCSIYEGLVDIKDGLVRFDNEYYLPAPYMRYEDGNGNWNGKRENIKDGKYNVTLLKQENSWYPREDISLRKDITLNLFVLGSEVKLSVKDLKPNTNELWAGQYRDPIIFKYNTSTWDGITFELYNVDIVNLFRKYFITDQWSKEVKVDISDDEIRRLLYSVENNIREVLRGALVSRSIVIDITDSYGEISVSNSLRFNNDIAEEVFKLITECIAK